MDEHLKHQRVKSYLFPAYRRNTSKAESLTLMDTML